MTTKLRAELSGNSYEIKLDRNGTALRAEVEGHESELEVRPIQPGLYLVIADGKVFECRAARDAAHPERIEVTLKGHSYAVHVHDPKRLRDADAALAQADGAAQIVAPMPGKVVRVLVAVGTEVEAGAGLVVVEAMKMQNEMKAPRAGIVTALNVEAGTTVNAGEVLAVIE